MNKALKESTIKLCRQLHENPDVAGNDKMIERHKNNLITRIGEVIVEQEDRNKFEDFENYVRNELQS